MSSGSIEDRIVSIKFDNAEFESKITSTLGNLDQLTNKLKDVAKGDNFAAIGAQANAVNLEPLTNSVDKISGKFTSLGAIAFSALQKITQSTLGFIGNMAQNDILAPIISGGKTRAGNIEQAKFQFQGLGMDVKSAMDSSLKAVQGTAYGLDEAAKAAAQFGASGIGAGDQMTAALRGIAGTAALTGRSYGEMAQIFTGSAGSGKVNNQDLMQFATRGLNAAAAYGKVINKTEAQVHEMAAAGDIDFKSFAAAMDTAFGQHATEANKTYAGSLANMHAAMSRMGASFFAPEQQQQRDLFNALTPVIDNVTKAFGPLIDMFMAIRGLLNNSFIDKLNKLDFTNLKLAIPNFAAGFGAAFEGVAAIFNRIKEAFKEVFPPSTTSTLIKISEEFNNFGMAIGRLKTGGETLDKLSSIFRGFFSLLSIGWEIIKGVALVFKDLITAIFPAGDGILSFGASTGDLITKLQKLLVQGGAIHDFFAKLGEIIAYPVAFISKLSSKIEEFFSSSAKIGSNALSSHFEEIGNSANKAASVWDRLVQALSGVGDVLGKVWNVISTWFSTLGHNIANVMKPADFNSVLDILDAGLLGGIALMLKKFFAGGVQFGFGGGLVNKVNSSISNLTKTMQAMQTVLKSDALLKIALAILAITASVVILSSIDSEKLAKALIAISVGFGMLAGAMAVLDVLITSNSSAVKLSILGLGLIGLAIAMDILALAIKSLSKLSWEELLKGLTGVGIALGILSLALKALSGNTEGMIKAGISIGIISISLLILSKAIKSFSDMSWGEMVKGFTGIAIGLGLIVIALNAMPASTITNALGFAVIAVGLTILATAVKSFANMSWSEMGKGLLGIAGALLVVAGAAYLMPPDLPLIAAGILILSVALGIMAESVKAMGSMDFGTLAKGIGAFAVMLLILAVAVNAMNTSVIGAAALVIVAGALLILVEVLKELGKLSIAQIATGLITIAAALAILGLASFLLEPVIPAMIGLGVALATVGVGFALFGVAALLFAEAINIIAVSGVAAAIAVVKGLTILTNATAPLAASLVLLVLNFVEELAKAIPTVLKVLTVVLLQIFDTLITLAPKLAKTLIVIIKEALKLLREVFPDLVKTGYEMLLALMHGISDNIGEIVKVAAEILHNFATALSDNIDSITNSVGIIIDTFITAVGTFEMDIINAGVNVLVSFIQGIGDNINLIVDAVTNLIITLLESLATHAVDLITAGASILIYLLQGITDNIIMITDAVVAIIVQLGIAFVANVDTLIQLGVFMLDSFLLGIAGAIIKVANTVTTIIVAFIGAIASNAVLIISAGADAVVNFLTGVENSAQKVVDAGTTLLEKFMTAVAGNVLSFITYGATLLDNILTAIDNVVVDKTPEISSKGVKIGIHILEGMAIGVADAFQLGKLKDAIVKVFDMLPQWAKDILGIKSPSTVFAGIGKNVIAGMVVGLGDSSPIQAAAQNMSNNLISSFQKTLDNIPNSLGVMDNFNPTITPVLDLSKVKAASGDIAKYMQVSDINAASSLTQAAVISNTTALSPSTAAASAANNNAGTTVTFAQTINAPTALSTNDIYRNTKSQIVMAKEALGIV